MLTSGFIRKFFVYDYEKNLFEMRYFFYTLFVLLVVKISYAQLNDFSRVSLVPIAENPAYAGTFYMLGIGYVNQTKWIGDKDDPTEHVLSFDSRIFNDKNAIGGFYGYFTSGDMTMNNFNLSYSHKFKINNLSITSGIGILYNQQEIKNATIFLDDFYSSSYDSYSRLMLNAGVLIHNQKFYVSLSYNSFLLYESEDAANTRKGIVLLTTGYHFLKDKSISICPSIIYRRYSWGDDVFGLNFTTTFRNRVWLGYTYDSYENFTWDMGINIWKCYGGFRMKDYVDDIIPYDGSNDSYWFLFTGFNF